MERITTSSLRSCKASIYLPITSKVRLKHLPQKTGFKKDQKYPLRWLRMIVITLRRKWGATIARLCSRCRKQLGWQLALQGPQNKSQTALGESLTDLASCSSFSSLNSWHPACSLSLTASQSDRPSTYGVRATRLKGGQICDKERLLCQ